MASTIDLINDFLARSKQANLLCENTESLNSGIIRMIVDSLPEIALNEEFRKRMSEILKDKISQNRIDKIAQVLVNELPIRAENILKSLVI